MTDRSPRNPYAVTMWDYSYITRRNGAEAEYADWDRVLDEVVERGYRCIRIEALPHLIAAGQDGFVLDTATVLAQDDYSLWGNHAPVELSPAADVCEFIGKARDRDLTVGLSTWFIEDTTGRAAAVQTPADYERIWTETLDLLDREGLLGAVEWVDLQNEFPLAHYTPAYENIFGVPRDDGSPIQRSWTEAEMARATAYFEPIDGLRQRWPDLRYTVSYTSILQVLELDTSLFDVCESHIWLGPLPPFAADTDHNAAMRGEDDEALVRHVAAVDEVYWADPEAHHPLLRGWMDMWMIWADERGLPMITTEGWASIHYDTLPTPSGRDPWDYMRAVAEVAVDHALEKGWEGICTSNFSQPHFADFWADAAWHRTVNDRINAGTNP